MEKLGWAEAWAIAEALLGRWQSWAALGLGLLLALMLVWSVASRHRLCWRWVGGMSTLLGAVWVVAGLAGATGVLMAVMGRALAEILFARCWI